MDDVPRKSRRCGGNPNNGREWKYKGSKRRTK